MVIQYSKDIDYHMCTEDCKIIMMFNINMLYSSGDIGQAKKILGILDRFFLVRHSLTGHIGPKSELQSNN